MAEFREMMEQQMAKSASVLYSVAGGAGGASTHASRKDITDAMKTEFAYQVITTYSVNINSITTKVIRFDNIRRFETENDFLLVLELLVKESVWGKCYHRIYFCSHCFVSV